MFPTKEFHVKCVESITDLKGEVSEKESFIESYYDINEALSKRDELNENHKTSFRYYYYVEQVFL